MIKFYGDYEVYSESGVDLTLLRENLRRSLEERWEYNLRAVELARAFEEAGRMSRALPPQRGGPSDNFDSTAPLRRLLDNRVAFVVVGGLAMTTQGCPN